MSAGILQRKEYRPGSFVFREGDEGNNAYVLQSGLVDIVKLIDGKEKILGQITKGGIFGEMALIDNKPRMAAARVAEPSVVIIVSRGTFEEKLKRTDPFIRGLLHIFAENIRNLSSK